MRSRRALVLLTLIAVGLLIPVTPQACGPEPYVIQFVGNVHPDDATGHYLDGQLGVLQPTYARVYLYVAYRHLTSDPFSPEERAAVASYWQPPASVTPPPESAEKGRYHTWYDQWKVERAKLPGFDAKAAQYVWADSNGIFRVVPGSEYQSYVNCPQDAFRNAAQTLLARIAQFGAQSQEVQLWLAGQDQVFQNCSGSAKEQTEPFVPSPADASWHPLIRADRAYQIGAALFYGQRFDDAGRQFDEIARDPESPWRKLAPYLAARAHIRKATLTGSPSLAEAEARLEKILADPNERELHDAARRMRGFVRFRLRPEERRRELSTALRSPQEIATRAQDLIDYTRLLDSVTVEPYGYYATQEERAKGRAEAFAKAAAGVADDPLADWILTFQTNSAAAQDHASKRWEETHSPAWLVAALSKVPGRHPLAAALVAEADRLPRAFPGYATATFHAIRVLEEAGNRDEARARLDAWLAAKEPMPRSARNLVRAARMKAARNLEEFLAYAPRVPAEADPANPSPVPGEEANRTVPSQFDVDMIAVFNQFLPLERIVVVVNSHALPPQLQRELTLAAWTRALLLGRHDVALALADEVERVAPEMRFVLRDYRAAKDSDGQEFAATYALLSFPGLEPYLTMAPNRMQHRVDGFDHWRDNWWCGYAQEMETAIRFEGSYRMREWSSWALRTIYPTGQVEPPAFLTEEEKQSAREESARLAALPTAPNYLAQRATEWATKQPEDPLVPEALHQAVMGTRWGCSDGETGKYSRQAFELLHKRYPKSSWAQKTKYWYGDEY